MNIFSPEVHRPERLTEQLFLIQHHNPNLLVVGSLGRSAVMHGLVGDPHAEFRFRGQDALKKGDAARDIDVIDLENESVGAEPFPVDASSYSNEEVRVINQNGDWFLVLGDEESYETLHPAVMEPVEGEGVYGALLTTVPAATHQALLKLRGPMRHKDWQAYEYMGRAIEQSGQPQPPAKLYEPFEKLHQTLGRDLIARIHRAYQNYVPDSVRVRAFSVVRPIKRSLHVG